MTEEFNDTMTPYLYWTIMAEGHDVAWTGSAIQTMGGWSRLNLMPTGTHPRYRSMATYFDLALQDVQWMKQDMGLLRVTAQLNVDAYPVGYWTPFVIDVNQQPNNAPGGLLHWMKDNPIYPNGDWSRAPEEFDRFSLMVTRERVA